MRRSKFSEEQVVAILREGQSGVGIGLMARGEDKLQRTSPAVAEHMDFGS